MMADVVGRTRFVRWAILLPAALPLLAARQDLPIFAGYQRCLVVEEQRQLSDGAPMLAVAPKQPPRKVLVEEMSRWTGPARERQGDRDLDCSSVFRADITGQKASALTVTRLARVSALPRDEFGVFFAVPQSGILVIGGTPEALSPADRDRLVDGIKGSLPASWQLDRALVRAYRYGPASNREIVELYVGLPVLNAPGVSPPIARIAIQRHFLLDGRSVAVETYERASGVEERAETEPPQLTHENWAESETEQTAAFVSTDDGRTWNRLSTDIGFERINWNVHALRAGVPLVLQRSVYTPH
jgi:hypothetical protein